MSIPKINPSKHCEPDGMSRRTIIAEKPGRRTAAGTLSLVRTDDPADALNLRARDDDTAAYLVELGQRVRSIRALRGMSRKVLAGASGLSERYIAQLESGQGNLSIVLLRRIAQATGAPIEDLVADGKRHPADWPLFRELLANASPAQIEQARSHLGRTGTAKASVQPGRIALIGLRGAGKSTLGQRAAQALGCPFAELNREIESGAGLPIAEIFPLYGQDGYRRLERAALDRIIARPGPLLLATGGGIVADAVTFERLLGHFTTIWIKASPAEHMGRVRAQGDLRPMAHDKAAMAELIAILKSREPFYARASQTIDTAGRSIDESVDALLATIAQDQTGKIRT